MNRLAMIATTCVLGLLLTACGDKGASKPAATKADAAAEQTLNKDNAAKTDAGTDAAKGQ